MVNRWQFWTLTVVAALTAALVAANMYRFSANRQLQADIGQRNLFIQQSVALENLSREIALALAQLSVRTQDAQIRTMLTSLGISIQVAPGEVSTAPVEARGGARR